MCDKEDLAKEIKKMRITLVTLFYWDLIGKGREDTAEKFKRKEMRHCIE